MPAYDLQFIKAVRDGDEKAFRKVFHDYYNRLYNYALHYVIDQEIAREIVQDSFMKLWETRSRLKYNSNLGAFLFTLTRNGCLNYLKHLLIQRKHTEKVRKDWHDYQLNYIALSDETSEKIIFDELHEKVQRAIDRLPPKCREIFVMSRTRELKHKEIANLLNISHKTVENQISEALRRIRLQLQDYMP